MMGGDIGDAMTDHPQPSPSVGRQVVAGFVFLLAALAAGAVGAAIQGGDVSGRYLALERPGWAPPAWLFGLVWPVLYVLIGLAAWWLWRGAGRVAAIRTALTLWAVQLVVNAAWPGVFFGLEEFWLAAGVIGALDVLVVATIAAFWRHDRIAAVLLVPYLAWIVFATGLNVAVAALN